MLPSENHPSGNLIQKRRYGTIRRAHNITSCRKFDQYGDWYFVRHPMVVCRIFKRDVKQADRFYYDARPDAGRHYPSTDD